MICLILVRHRVDDLENHHTPATAINKVRHCTDDLENE